MNNNAKKDFHQFKSYFRPIPQIRTNNNKEVNEESLERPKKDSSHDKRKNYFEKMNNFTKNAQNNYGYPPDTIFSSKNPMSNCLLTDDYGLKVHNEFQKNNSINWNQRNSSNNCLQFPQFRPEPSLERYQYDLKYYIGSQSELNMSQPNFNSFNSTDYFKQNNKFCYSKNEQEYRYGTEWQKLNQLQNYTNLNKREYEPNYFQDCNSKNFHQYDHQFNSNRISNYNSFCKFKEINSSSQNELESLQGEKNENKIFYSKYGNCKEIGVFDKSEKSSNLEGNNLEHVQESPFSQLNEPDHRPEQNQKLIYQVFSNKNLNKQLLTSLDLKIKEFFKSLNREHSTELNLVSLQNGSDTQFRNLNNSGLDIIEPNETFFSEKNLNLLNNTFLLKEEGEREFRAQLISISKQKLIEIKKKKNKLELTNENLSKLFNLQVPIENQQFTNLEITTRFYFVCLFFFKHVHYPAVQNLFKDFLPEIQIDKKLKQKLEL